MLLYTESRMPNGSIFDYPILPSEVGYIEEGMALVLATLNGKEYVQRSVGNGTEQFVGVAFGPRRETIAPGYRFIPFQIDPLAISLTYSDIHNVATVGGSTAPFVVYTVTDAYGNVLSNTVFTAITTGTPVTGQYKVLSTAPLSILFSAADAGKTVNVGFNYTPTLDDVTFNLGWTGQAYGGLAIDYLATVPVITQAVRITTDKFVGSCDWFTSPGSPLKVTAGGYFATGSSYPTTGGSITATDISGQNLTVGPAYARVISGPNTDTAGLTISINM